MMVRVPRIVQGATLLCVALAGLGLAVARARAVPRLSDSASSERELVERFLGAVNNGDKHALNRLRVTEDEYKAIIMAGSVPPGAPVRQWTDDVNEYFWQTLNGKSIALQAALLRRVKGRQLKLKSYLFEEGQTEFATYTALRQLRMLVEDDRGAEFEIASGSIANVGGQYKFISFIRD